MSKQQQQAYKPLPLDRIRSTPPKHDEDAQFSSEKKAVRSSLERKSSEHFKYKHPGGISSDTYEPLLANGTVRANPLGVSASNEDMSKLIKKRNRGESGMSEDLEDNPILRMQKLS